MAEKLYIYDRSSFLDRVQAFGRFSNLFQGEDVTTIGATSRSELIDRLDDLVRQRVVFRRALFQTHGHPGGIYFGGDSIGPTALSSVFASHGHWALFPQGGKIYFDGCNVADGDDGWDFLSAVGPAFLKLGGGSASGWTSLGSAMPGPLPFVGGHTIHFYGELRTVQFGPGGIVLEQPGIGAGRGSYADDGPPAPATPRAATLTRRWR